MITSDDSCASNNSQSQIGQPCRTDNIKAIASYLRQGIKQAEQLGLELEHILIHKESSAPVTYSEDCGIKAILEKFSSSYPVRQTDIEDELIGVSRNNAAVTLEPASQLEISAGPFSSLKELEDSIKSFEDELSSILTPWNEQALLTGYNPSAKADDLQLIPKRRYQFMDEHFKKIGPFGTCMMRASAATQVSIDFNSEQDCINKMRLSCILAPILSLITDNSPIFEGNPRLHQLVRTKIWNECDPARCGSIPEIFNANYTFEDYARYILDTPAILFPCPERGWCPTEKTFAELYANKIMTEAEIEHAISMHFNDVRVKHYVEIRPADALPVPYALAYVAFIKGIFYQEEAISSLLDSFSEINEADIAQAKADLMDYGYDATVYGKPVSRITRELLSFARKGLSKEEQLYLAPISDLIRTQETLAQRIETQNKLFKLGKDNSDTMVTVAYRGFFDDGAVFIDQRDPIDFPCCLGWMPPAFIETVRSMKIGETRITRVGANEAYEERTEERLIHVSREKLPEGIIQTPVGELVNLEDPSGQTYPARVYEVTETEIIFDMNHDAICKSLNFEITLLRSIDLSQASGPRQL